jgi:adenylosuccinate lyase
VVRANAALLAECQVHDHERDGRSWKAEWHAVPELTMAAGKVHALLTSLLEGLEVCTERMRANLEASGGFALSEQAMLALAPHIGKETARRVIQRVAASARREGRSFAAALAGDRDICACLTKEELNWLTAFDAQMGQCQALVDRVLLTQRGSATSELVG